MAITCLTELLMQLQRFNIHLFVITMPLAIDKKFVLVRTNWQVYDCEEVFMATNTNSNY